MEIRGCCSDRQMWGGEVILILILVHNRIVTKTSRNVGNTTTLHKYLTCTGRIILENMYETLGSSQLDIRTSLIS